MGNTRRTRPSRSKIAAGKGDYKSVLATLEAIAAPVVLVDAGQRIVLVNRHVVHRFGYANAELVGQPLTRLFRTERYEGSAQDLAGIMRLDATTTRIATDAYCADGTCKAVVIEVGRFNLDDAPHILCLFREATTVPDAAHAGSVEQRLGEAQRIAKIGSWSLDIATDEHWWSDELYRMLQLDRGSEPRPFERFMAIVASDRPPAHERRCKALTGRASGAIELRLTLPDGTPKTFQSRGAATLDSPAA